MRTVPRVACETVAFRHVHRQTRLPVQRSAYHLRSTPHGRELRLPALHLFAVPVLPVPEHELFMGPADGWAPGRDTSIQNRQVSRNRRKALSPA